MAARELRIGRPDLPRVLDDGGLIDVNGVPEQVFASIRGISPDQAKMIVTERQLHGDFGSPDDLVVRGLISASQARTLGQQARRGAGGRRYRRVYLMVPRRLARGAALKGSSLTRCISLDRGEVVKDPGDLAAVGSAPAGVPPGCPRLSP